MNSHRIGTTPPGATRTAQENMRARRFTEAAPGTGQRQVRQSPDNHPTSTDLQGSICVDRQSEGYSSARRGESTSPDPPARFGREACLVSMSTRLSRGSFSQLVCHTRRPHFYRFSASHMATQEFLVHRWSMAKLSRLTLEHRSETTLVSVRLNYISY